jgi:hypothetical protein
MSVWAQWFGGSLFGRSIAEAGWYGYARFPRFQLGCGPYPTPIAAVDGVLEARNADMERCPMCGSSDWTRNRSAWEPREVAG